MVQFRLFSKTSGCHTTFDPVSRKRTTFKPGEKYVSTLEAEKGRRDVVMDHGPCDHEGNPIDEAEAVEEIPSVIGDRFEIKHRSGPWYNVWDAEKNDWLADTNMPKDKCQELIDGA